MGIFYNPPQPTQAATHAPISAQGQQPPYRPIAALAVAVSLAWTPTPAPTQGPRNVAPLIPAAIVNQPAPQSRALAQAIRGIWDSQPSWNSQKAAPVAPLTLVYGQQPPRYAGACAMANMLATPALTWNAQAAAPNAAWNFVAAAVNQPPSVSIAVQAAIRSIWPVDVWSSQRPPWLAPLTLTYGQQPPQIGQIQPAVFSSIVASWNAPGWISQSEFDNAAWNSAGAAPVAQPYSATAVFAAIASAWTPTSSSAQSASPNAAWNVTFVALAQVPFCSTAAFSVIANSWNATPWTPQSEFDNAGWNVSAPAATQVAPASPALVASILASWNSPGWAAQSETDNAGWNQSATAAPQPFAAAPNPNAYLAWVVSWSLQSATRIASVIPPVVNNPAPTSAVNQFSLARSWPPAWYPTQSAPLKIQPYVVVLSLVRQEFTTARDQVKFLSGEETVKFIAPRERVKFNVDR